MCLCIRIFKFHSSSANPSCTTCSHSSQTRTEVRNMNIKIIAACFAVVMAALPVAAQAAQDCGVPQGYGTTNPFTFNRSTCGFTAHVDSRSGGAAWGQATNDVDRTEKPAGYGTTNPYIPNSGAPDLGSNSAGM